MKKMIICVFALFWWVDALQAQPLPEGWSYECSDQYDLTYGAPCVLKNSTGWIMLTSLSEAFQNKDELPKSIKSRRSEEDGLCYLFYVRAIPFGVKPPRSYIVQNDFMIIRGLGVVEDRLCENGR